MNDFSLYLCKIFERLINQILKESSSIVVLYIREEINYKKEISAIHVSNLSNIIAKWWHSS